jgi:hypothetical protein
VFQLQIVNIAIYCETITALFTYQIKYLRLEFYYITAANNKNILRNKVYLFHIYNIALTIYNDDQVDCMLCEQDVELSSRETKRIYDNGHVQYNNSSLLWDEDVTTIK